VGRSHTTHRLALGARTLSSSQIRPLFRAMTHQTHITAVMISDNSIGDDGVKYLAECLCTLKQLTHLDISRNNITVEGTKLLLNIFEKAIRPVCQVLEELDVSSNPIADNGFRNISRICQYVRLKVLKLNSCKMTQNAVNDSVKSNLNFDSLEAIDVSNNDVKIPMVSCLMTSLNPNLMTDLELDNVGVEGNVVGCIAAFMDSSKDLKIRRFGLSNCNLVDGQFMRIFR
jgi:Ran GTPase-activating protein (RanGAP) involved in mRNA processing and transport